MKMPKIISISNNEIVFRLPAQDILKNKSVIYLLGNYVEANIRMEDVIKAQEISKQSTSEGVIFIITKNGMKFHPE